MKIPRGLKTFLVIFLLIALAFGCLSLLIIYQRSRLDGLKEAVAALEEETVALRFKILERGPDGISFRLRFYDRDGTEVGTAEKKIGGQSLFIDFQVVKAEAGYIAFPERVFTDTVAANQGLSLLSSYDRNGFPAILDKKTLAPSERKAFASLFLAVKQGRAPQASFGSAVHDVKDLAGFDVGTVYKIVSRKKGGIEVLED
jgi:hypothetical protein